MLTCGSCGTANPNGFRFCGACGAPLPGAPQSVEPEPRVPGERKVITVLMCDLVGSTELGERLDPEDVDRLLREYHGLARRRIESHGGTLEKFIGDAVVGIFGAPVSHEDDAERAVRAALRVIEDVGRADLGLHVRVGVSTGEALVRVGIDPASGEGLATGDCLNVAARLQAAAPADGVVVSGATRRATATAITYEPLAPLVAKGKTQPLEMWHATGTMARPSHGLEPETTPFVGRAFELEALVRLLERSWTNTSFEAVTIVADPGLGKSRLVRELARRVDALPDLVTWRVGRCLPYGDEVGFWALSEIVAAQAGILETDDQVALSAKLDVALTETDPSLRRWMRDRLAPLVGLETTAEPPQQEEAFTAWRRFLESIARRRPLVLVFEDIHWADEGLVAFLRHLPAHAAGLPITLIVTARPELEERHPAWLARARRSTVLSLDALPDRDLAALVEAILPGASPQTTAAVLGRAAGSPLYAEQLATMLREGSGSLDESAVPPTLVALLASRIDALPRAVKPALLDASVVGRTFWSGAVAALGRRARADVEPFLADLARHDLVRPVHPSSMADEQEYTFVHALVRDVAFSELPRSARLAKHRAAAGWIAERSGGARGRTAELVAAHLEQALGLALATRATDELPALRDALAEALLGATDHALATRPAAAPAFARRMLELLEPTDPRRPGALVALGRALLTSFEYAAAAAALDDAATLLGGQGDHLATARLAPLRTRALVNAGEGERAVAVLAAARAALAADPGGDLAAVIAEQAQAAMVVADDARAIELAAEAIELAAALGLPPPHRALGARGLARYRADADAGEIDLLAAIDTAVMAGDLSAAVVAHTNRVGVRADSLGVAAGLMAAEEAIVFCAARGLPTERVDAQRLQLLVPAGRWDQAIDAAGSLHGWAAVHGDAWAEFVATRAVAAVGLGRGELAGPLDELAALGRATLTPPPHFGVLVAGAELARGDPAAARRAIEDTLDTSTAGGLDFLADLVRIALRAGSPALARRALEFRAVQGPLGIAETRTAEAELAEAEGRLAEARGGYEAALWSWSALGLVVGEAETRLGLGRCLLALGETEEGVTQLREARELWAGMKATPRIAEVDALLATVE